MVDYIDRVFNRVMAEALLNYPEDEYFLNRIIERYRRKGNKALQAKEIKKREQLEKKRQHHEQIANEARIDAEVKGTAHKSWRVWDADRRDLGVFEAGGKLSAVRKYLESIGAEGLKVFYLNGEIIVADEAISPPYLPWRVEAVSAKNLFLWKIRKEGHVLFIHGKIDFDKRWAKKKGRIYAFVVQYDQKGGKFPDVARYRRLGTLKQWEAGRRAIPGWEDFTLADYEIGAGPEDVNGVPCL